MHNFKESAIQKTKTSRKQKNLNLESFYTLLISLRFHMTKVHCYNFIEQIYQWFEYRKKTCWSFSLYLIKLSLKMIGWKEQEAETELHMKHLKLSVAHFKACCNFLLVWAKTSSFNISHFSRSSNLARHQDLREESLSFLMLYLPKSKIKFSLRSRVTFC